MNKVGIVFLTAGLMVSLVGCSSGSSYTADSILETLERENYQGACKTYKYERSGGQVTQVSCISSVDSSFDVEMDVFESEEHLFDSFTGVSCNNQRYRLGSNVIITDGDDGELSPYFDGIELLGLAEFVPGCQPLGG